jgi:hypothetical protein
MAGVRIAGWRRLAAWSLDTLLITLVRSTVTGGRLLARHHGTAFAASISDSPPCPHRGVIENNTEK